MAVVKNWYRRPRKRMDEAGDIHSWTQKHFAIVAKSCPTLCEPMDCSTQGFLVLHCLPKFLILAHKVLFFEHPCYFYTS